MIGTTMSNQTILFILVVVLLIIIGLVWYTLSHKYEATGPSAYGGGTKRLHPDDRDDDSDDDDDHYASSVSSFNINHVLESDTSSVVSFKSEQSVAGVKPDVRYGSSQYTRLTVSFEDYKKIIDLDLKSVIRYATPYVNRLKKDDIILLSRTKPAVDEKVKTPYRFLVRIAEVKPYKTMKEAIDDFDEKHKASMAKNVKEFPPKDMNEEDLKNLGAVRITFAPESIKPGYEEAVKRLSNPRPLNDSGMSSSSHKKQDSKSSRINFAE